MDAVCIFQFASNISAAGEPENSAGQNFIDRHYCKGINFIDIMRRTISSPFTAIMKIIFPAVWVPLFGLGVLLAFFGTGKNGTGYEGYYVLAAWVAGIVFIFWYGVRLKYVSVDENNLYVSNFLREIPIPLADIYNVTENIWLNIHPVTIHLKTPSAFGRKIMFMPTTGNPWYTPHPIVEELKSMAAAKRLLPKSFE